LVLHPVLNDQDGELVTERLRTVQHGRGYDVSWRDWACCGWWAPVLGPDAQGLLG
jgi:hypothetical protein